MLQKLQKAWYSNANWVWVLAPLSFLFWILSSLRRSLYTLGVLSSKGANIPVVVVGNIGLGGNGKTPLVLALVNDLRAKGYTPAVLSRGYGGTQTQFPYRVNKEDPAQLVGDEPALIVQRENTLMVIDPVRARGVWFIEHNTNANVIICDDGLQHYAMKRDIELCVLDKRGVGNGYLLPMGPLREGKWRLAKVDAVVHNLGFTNIRESTNSIQNTSAPEFSMSLQPMRWVNVSSKQNKSLDDFKVVLEEAEQIGMQIEALAGIGDPKRFFDTLVKMNIKTHRQIGFADHHQFVASDLSIQNMVLMTQKDAVKCIEFAHENCWYLEISAHLPDNFFKLIEQGIETKANQLTKSRA